MTSENQHGWPSQAGGSSDVTTRDDLDLGACLEEAEDLQEDLNLYSDGDTSPQNSSWVEHVIEMTSSQETVSPEDHTEMSDSGNTVSGFSLGQGQYLDRSTTTTTVHFGHMDSFAASSDNARFPPFETLLAEDEFNSSSQLDLSGFETLHSAHTSGSAPSIPSAYSRSETLTSSHMNRPTSPVSITASSTRESPFETFQPASTTDSIPPLPSTHSRVEVLPSQSSNTCLEPGASSSTSGATSMEGYTKDNIPVISPSSSDGSQDTIKISGISNLQGVAGESAESSWRSDSSLTVGCSASGHSGAQFAVASTSRDADVRMRSFQRSPSSSSSSMTQSMEGDYGDPEDPKALTEKREKNRIAAQKSRDKKNERREKLEQDVSRLERKQERLKEEVQKLTDEKETLEEIIHVHGFICPKIRKTSGL